MMESDSIRLPSGYCIDIQPDPSIDAVLPIDCPNDHQSSADNRSNDHRHHHKTHREYGCHNDREKDKLNTVTERMTNPNKSDTNKIMAEGDLRQSNTHKCGETKDSRCSESTKNDRRERVDTNQDDDNWGETTTAITGTTSEAGYSVDDMSRYNKQLEASIGFNCARYTGSILTAVVGSAAFISPIIMVVLPKIIGAETWPLTECNPDCEGLLISFSFKLIILIIASWAIFFRKPKATMPRIFIFRSVLLLLLFVLLVAYWLFYGVRIISEHNQDYQGIVAFALSMVDVLLFIHYLAVVLLELRQLQPQYVVKVLRSPDGAVQAYTVGQLSIQRLAIWCLEQYYKDFSLYNRYLEHASRRRSSRFTSTNSFKVYNIDGTASDTTSAHSRAILIAAAARNSQVGHNERFYEEMEYERRIRKRRARLMVAADEAFVHVKRLQQDKGKPCPCQV